MFGLPKSTEINKPLPKKAVFDKFKLKSADRKLFDDQISRMVIIAEISPQTVSIAASDDFSAIYIILLILKSYECDKKNIALLSKLIDQHMLFALRYEETMRLAVYRADRVLMSESKHLDKWKLNLHGLDLSSAWDNIIAEIAGIDISSGKDLNEGIINNELKEKLTKQIAELENKAKAEKQPRHKWNLVNEIKKLRTELEEILNG